MRTFSRVAALQSHRVLTRQVDTLALCTINTTEFQMEVCVDNRLVHLQICDAGGGNEVASLRQFSYPGVHVLLLCFSVVKPSSFRSLRDKWLDELSNAHLVFNPAAKRLVATRSSTVPPSERKVRSKELTKHLSAVRSRSCGPTRGIRQLPEAHRIPGPAFLLVGCACDLRNDIGQLLELSKHGEEPVDKKTAEQLASQLGAEAYVECSALTQKNLKTVFDLAIWCGLRVAELGGPAQCNQISSFLETKNGSVVSPGSSRKSTISSLHNASHNPPGFHQPKTTVEDPKIDKRLWRKLFCMH
ncbi:Rho-related GTP-binding protein RhoU [Clonorchis sinensis]|uniref:Rho-related GTP-binding protein RhoU n=1 Tax=Clonorchis sinensis TaxID=79923 RepID=G7YMZ4_CLOSI|nr:Rho-related GTP-binding protein RhoU [Clonorchis sinensis]